LITLYAKTAISKADNKFLPISISNTELLNSD